MLEGNDGDDALFAGTAPGGWPDGYTDTLIGGAGFDRFYQTDPSWLDSTPDRTIWEPRYAW